MQTLMFLSVPLLDNDRVIEPTKTIRIVTILHKNKFYDSSEQEPNSENQQANFMKIPSNWETELSL